MVEHRSAESEGLRFSSLWGVRIFSLSNTRRLDEKTFLHFVTQLKTYHFSYFIYKDREVLNEELCCNEWLKLQIESDWGSRIWRKKNEEKKNNWQALENGSQSDSLAREMWTDSTCFKRDFLDAVNSLIQLVTSEYHATPGCGANHSLDTALFTVIERKRLCDIVST